MATELPCTCRREPTGCPSHDQTLVIFAAPADWRQHFDGADPVRVMEPWQIRPEVDHG